MKIAIIDDHSLILDGIKGIVRQNDKVEYVKTYDSAQEFLKNYNEEEVDIIITDIEMPGMTGTELVSAIRDVSSSQRILVLSMHKDHSLIHNLFNLKVNGYMMKDSSPGLLNEALDAIMSTGRYLTKEIEDVLGKEEDNEEYTLTKREIQIVQLISNGLSNKEIGEKCFISETTVKTHRKNIMLKLNLKNTAELVRYAIENKIS